MEKKRQKISQFNILGVNLQILITIVVVVLGIICLLGHDLYFFLEVSIALDLLVMAYNNYKIYHKKNLTWIYIIVAVLVFIAAIVSKLGVLK